MKIGIAGAGIGGLAAAAFLAGDGHDVTVLDQFDAPRPVGSGLVLQPVGRAVLDALGVGDQARRLGTPLAAMLGHEADSGRTVLDVSYGTTAERQGHGIHRAALHHVVLEAAKAAGATLIPGQQVVSRDGQSLRTADRAHGPYDLIIDASGAGSALSPLTARPLSYGAIWATVPWPDETDLPQNRLSQRYRRADRMLGVLPIGCLPDAPDQQLAAVFYSLPARAEGSWRAVPMADVRAEALALWPDLAPFFPARLTHADFTFASYTHGSLGRPYADGIVFIGDAAHRASPQLGQGANMALLDAHALALALRQKRGDEALRLYAGARRWHVATYQALSAAFTPQYQSDSAVLPILRDYLLAPLSQIPPVPRMLTRLVCGDLVPVMPALTPLAARRG